MPAVSHAPKTTAKSRRPPAEQALGGLAHELLERVGLDQVVGGDDLGHQRAEAGPKKASPAP
jgi:hypothetical protein